ncbi:MAG: hypothetical protein Unbinned5179contig1001_12 [Prokaryotic dsDNA virus sp.]|nr:MAG: hypothetical protein Unbinned5179contig1001_12 [Prokaryotic dsDNA virus sp.]|tara:strand:- start:459 stop:776 length:318 start_codon:yes stop_codon:yes gene_type:complete
MSGIKTLLGDGATGVDDFDLGEDFGRYAMGQELLPLLKAARREVKAFLSGWRSRDMHIVAPASFNQIATTLEGLETVIADIERPRETPKGATASEIEESINDIPF